MSIDNSFLIVWDMLTGIPTLGVALPANAIGQESKFEFIYDNKDLTSYDITGQD
jgi:hypothetical protein